MEKYLCGAIMSIASFFAPVGPLVLCALVFVGIDFLTGVLADRRRVRAEGRTWAFESRKAWHTVTKLSLVMAGIVMAWLIDGVLLPFMELRLANIFTGFVCGVEFWSYLENASAISGNDLFRRAADFLRSHFLRKNS